MKIDPADKYFSQYVRMTQRECQRCHSPVEFRDGLPVSHQNSHFQGRRKESTRFTPENCDTLCGGCHQYFTSNPAEHYAWQVQTKGQGVVDRVVLASNSYTKKNRDLEKIYWKQQVNAILNK